MWIYIFTQHQLFTSWWADKPAWHQEIISLVTVDIKITTVRDKLSVTPHELVTREINERPAERWLTEEVKTNRTSAAGSLWVHYWGGGRDPNDPAHSPPGRTARCQNKVLIPQIFYIRVESHCVAQVHFFIQNLPHLEAALKHLWTAWENQLDVKLQASCFYVILEKQDSIQQRAEYKKLDLQSHHRLQERFSLQGT